MIGDDMTAVGNSGTVSGLMCHPGEAASYHIFPAHL